MKLMKPAGLNPVKLGPKKMSAPAAKVSVRAKTPSSPQPAKGYRQPSVAEEMAEGEKPMNVKGSAGYKGLMSTLKKRM